MRRDSARYCWLILPLLRGVTVAESCAAGPARVLWRSEYSHRVRYGTYTVACIYKAVPGLP